VLLPGCISDRESAVKFRESLPVRVRLQDGVRGAVAIPCPNACCLWLAALCLAVLLPVPTMAADSLRCGSRIVSTGARALEVEAVCGEPDYRDVWSYQVRGRIVADDEEWTYNFGANQLLRILHFSNGRLSRIDSDGYGFSTRRGANCQPADIVEGVSKYRLLARCGEPDAQEATQLLAPSREHRYHHAYPGGPRDWTVQQVYRERWLYDFGSSYLQREVTLENGRVTDVQNGQRGFLN